MTASRHSVCLLCNSSELSPLPGYEKAGLVRCASCHFIFCSRIPRTEELITHYNTYPRHDSISPITIRRYEELITSVKQYAATQTWLDVGCGNGHLLSVAARMGWKTFGTEFTDDAVAICRSKNISVQQGPLNVQHYPGISFDVITFIEVIEHINNPHEEVGKFHQLLRKGGLLYITTPNFNSLNRRRLGARWNIIEYPEHLCYYTPATLHRLLTQHGFKKVYLKTTGYNPGRIAGADAEKLAAGQQRNENLREMSESMYSMQLAKKTVNFLLNMFRSGDTIKAAYVKI